ncbi:MAG: tetraacyldisaccharide 4'-kinase [Bacteroidales bacterium]|nr:tetraacyldisaccharide 4'-kinase [Bacteroidales bacterium]
MAKKKVLLFPIAWLYGAGVRLRNIAFDIGLLKETSFDNVLVVGIGNLSAGGTGKTPLTEYLVKELSGKYKVAILSRGYGRKTKGFRICKSTDTSKEIGDEPLQFASKFSHIHIAVQENRCEGIKKIMELFPETQIILLDDSYQHRYVKPDVNILLTDYFDTYGSDSMLPVGRLREPVSGAKRADIVIVTKCEKVISPITIRSLHEHLHINDEHQTLLTSYIVYSPLLPFEKSKPIDLTEKKYTTAICFAGIANSYWFLGKLKTIFDDVDFIEFDDHHEYSLEELNMIVEKFHNNYGNRKVIVTTEKDAMRLKAPVFAPILSELPIYYLPMHTKLHDNEGDILIGSIQTCFNEKFQ